MTAQLLPALVERDFANNGVPLAFGNVFSYVPSPAAARKRSGSSGPTPNSTRCSARQIGDGDVNLPV